MKKILVIIAALMFVVAVSTSSFADSTANANANANAGATANNSQGQTQGQDQGQSQGQDQGQDQAQQQSNALGLNDVGNIKDSFNSKTKISPNFVVPGDVQYGFLVNHYAQPQKGFEFQTLRTALMYVNRFSEGALENILKSSEGMIHEMKVVNEGLEPLPVEENGARYITVIIVGKKVKQAEFVGFVSTQAKSSKTTSIEVLARAALDALKAGANVIQFTAEGAVLDTEASGWGIGFNSTFAAVTQAGQHPQSSVSSGGTGYSSATAGLREKPWLQAFALRLPDGCEIEYVD